MAFKGDLEALILAVLSDHALHGYEISKRIRTQSQEVLKYGEGQLYPEDQLPFVRAIRERATVIVDDKRREGHDLQKLKKTPVRNHLRVWLVRPVKNVRRYFEKLRHLFF